MRQNSNLHYIPRPHFDICLPLWRKNPAICTHQKIPPLSLCSLPPPPCMRTVYCCKSNEQSSRVRLMRRIILMVLFFELHVCAFFLAPVDEMLIATLSSHHRRRRRARCCQILITRPGCCYNYTAHALVVEEIFVVCERQEVECV